MKKIGTGVVSDVYLLDDTTVRKVYRVDVALKEFNILSRLNMVSNRFFPRIVSYNEKERYIDMSYCGQRISAENIPSGWMDQIIEISRILHRCGVLHFDIEPHNILVHNNEIKLIDFEHSVIEKMYLMPISEIDNYKPEHECIYLDDKIVFYDVIWAKNREKDRIKSDGVQFMQQKHKKYYDNLKALRKVCLGVLNYANV